MFSEMIVRNDDLRDRMANNICPKMCGNMTMLNIIESSEQG